MEVEEIENCEVYDSNGSCKKCDDGYHTIDNYPNCFLIPPEENCLQKEEHKGGCKTCKSGYAKLDGNCVLPTENFTHGCESHNVDGSKDLDKLKCNYCK